MPKTSNVSLRARTTVSPPSRDGARTYSAATPRRCATASSPSRSKMAKPWWWNWRSRRGQDARALVKHQELRGLFEQLTADQPAADFARAGADFVELGIAQEAPRRIIVDVAIAAQALDRLERHPHALFGRIENGTGGIFACRLPAIAGSRHGIHVGPRRRQRDIHVGKLALHQLEGPDRLAELLAVVKIGDEDVQAALHDADGARRKNGALVIEPAHQDAHALAFAAEHILRGHFAILKEELCRIGAAHAELVELLRRAKSLEAFLYEERRDAARPCRSIRLRVDHERVGVRRVGDPHLGAVEDVARALLFGTEAHRNDVGARTGLAHGQGTHMLA